MLNKEVVPSSPPPPQKKPRASRKGAQVVTPSKKVSVSLGRKFSVRNWLIVLFFYQYQHLFL